MSFHATTNGINLEVMGGTPVFKGTCVPIQNLFDYIEGDTPLGMRIAMKVATGKVVEGKIVVEGCTLQEGSVVAVLAHEAEGTFELTPEEEAEILLSIAEADRGELVSGEEVLKGLPGSRT